MSARAQFAERNKIVHQGINVHKNRPNFKSLATMFLYLKPLLNPLEGSSEELVSTETPFIGRDRNIHENTFKIL